MLWEGMLSYTYLSVVMSRTAPKLVPTDSHGNVYYLPEF